MSVCWFVLCYCSTKCVCVVGPHTQISHAQEPDTRQGWCLSLLSYIVTVNICTQLCHGSTNSIQVKSNFITNLTVNTSLGPPENRQFRDLPSTHIHQGDHELILRNSCILCKHKICWSDHGDTSRWQDLQLASMYVWWWSMHVEFV